MELIQAQKKIAAMRKRLKETIDGKFMIRRDTSYKGLEAENIYTFNVYFDIPISQNNEAIFEAIKEHGFYSGQSGLRVIGGSYGYIISFRTARNSL